MKWLVFQVLNKEIASVLKFINVRNHQSKVDGFFMDKDYLC